MKLKKRDHVEVFGSGSFGSNAGSAVDFDVKVTLT